MSALVALAACRGNACVDCVVSEWSAGTSARRLSDSQQIGVAPSFKFLGGYCIVYCGMLNHLIALRTESGMK